MNIPVAGITHDGDKVLLMRRVSGGSIGGLWEFPNGKIEPDENPRDALRREWAEETGLEISVGDEIARGGFFMKTSNVRLLRSMWNF